MIDILLMLVSAILILLSLLQGGKSEGLSSAFTGGNSGLNLFSDVKERGPERILSLVTMVVGALFFILAILQQVF